jgi:hypothetical protein
MMIDSLQKKFVVVHDKLMLLTFHEMTLETNLTFKKKERKKASFFKLASSHTQLASSNILLPCLKNDCWHNNYWLWRFFSFDSSLFIL